MFDTLDPVGPGIGRDAQVERHAIDGGAVGLADQNGMAG
jgi:hypothetical protein